jgi:hypothetical protein
MSVLELRSQPVDATHWLNRKVSFYFSEKISEKALLIFGSMAGGLMTIFTNRIFAPPPPLKGTHIGGRI